jgi:serine phosphatase RsbU (regulator of sigma subunit)/anti-sigma regulatory factor (Ser/Thr protein kinase)
VEKFPNEKRKLALKGSMPTNIRNGQEPGKLSGEIGAFGIARHFSMPCELARVRNTVLAARDFLASQGVENDDLLACELALVEACNNAIRYAPDSQRHLPVEIHLFFEKSRLEMHVVDHTEGFNWPDKVELPAPQQENGRGLFIIRSVMEQVAYLRGTEENRLVLRKTLKAHRAGQAALSPQDLQQKLALSEEVIGTMAKELCFRSEALAAIFRCTSELGKTNAVEELSYRLLADLLQIVAADWFILRLVPKDEKSRLLLTKSSQPGLTLDPICLEPERGMAANSVKATIRSRQHSIESSFVGGCAELQAAVSRKDVFFGPQNPLAPDDPLAQKLPRSVGLVQPIARGETLLGTLAIGRFEVEKPFTVDQVEVIYTFCEFLAIQIVNARLQKEQVDLRLTAHELEIARSIQQSLLPKTFPVLPGFGLSGFCLSARQVGGDFYDVLSLSDEQALLIVADVMGKGVPAALFAATLHTLAHTTAEWTHTPSELLARMNRLLFEELSGVDMFITAQLVLADFHKRRLVVASAGHCPLFVAGPTGNLRTVSPDGLPLGILPDVTYEQEILPLDECSCALLYTDGLTEARNSHGELFGQERLCTWLRQSVNKHKTAAELSENFLTEIRSFQSQAGLSDDQTFLILVDESKARKKLPEADVDISIILPAPAVAIAVK